MAVHGGGYIKWNAEEWLRVAANMLPLLDAGKPKYVALANAMRKALPKHRHQHDEWVGHTTQPARKFIDAKIALARQLTAEQRAMFVPPPAATPTRAAPAIDTRKLSRRGADEGRTYKGARWTEREWALIARMVKWFKVHGAQQTLSRLVIEAQELVLAAPRRRSIPGIQASVAGGRLEKSIAAAVSNIYLVTDVPFNPPLPPGAEPPAAEQPIAAQETAVAAPEPAPAIQPTTQAAPPPETGSIRDAMTAAAEAFAGTMRQALDTLLQTNTELVMREMQMRIEASSAAMGAQVAGMVESGMRKAVQRMMEHELGGPIAAPVDSPGAAPGNDGPRRHDPSPVARGPRPQQLAVDVLGFEIGSQQTLVRDAFSGEVDIRFIHPDTSTYTPQRNRHVVIMRGRVPHMLTDKLKAHKVDAISVDRTPGHVIHAIEELQRAQGMQHAH